MNRIGHTYGALMFSPVPAIEVGQHNPWLGALSALSCVAGGNLPDRLEFGVIPHRTITHTLSIWLALALYGYAMALGLASAPLDRLSATSGEIGAILCGFGCGGIAHWLGDIPNKQPVPVFTPFDGFALYLFNSGDHQRFTCGLIALEAWFFIGVLRT